MRLLKLDSVLIVLLMLCCFQSRSQEALNDVSIKKLSNSSFNIEYKLDSTNDYDIEAIVLKIFRRRNGRIEEIFSKSIMTDVIIIQSQTYSYNWKPDNGLIKAGDELQAKIILSFKPSLAKQIAKIPNKAPHADAGKSLELQLPATKSIVLNGSKSHDEDGKIVSAEWKQIAGPTNLIIQRKDSLIAYANGEFKEGTYAFELSVKDDQEATAISRTILHVKSAPVVIATPANPPVTGAATKKDTVVVRRVATEPVKTVTKLKGGPSNAAINLLLPGVGHYFVSGDYNGQNRKATSFILTAIYAGAIGGAFYFNEKSNSDYKKYNELANYREYQKDANGIIIGIRGGNQIEANRYFNSGKSAHRNALVCLGVAGGVLAGDLIYTFLKGSKNKREWQKENTSFKPNLFFSSNGLVTTAGVQFKF